MSRLNVRVLLLCVVNMKEWVTVHTFTFDVDTFSPNYKLTIGVDFSLKTLEWEQAKINLQLW